MKRLELFGPPGVGKTTIYNATMAMRDSSPCRFYNIYEARLFSEAGDAQWQNDPLWRPFLEFVALAYARCSGGEAMLRWRQRATRRAVADAVTIRSGPKDAVVLIDESLCHRGVSLALSRPDQEALIEGYFRAVPAPTAAGLVLASEQTISARNTDRKARGTGTDRSTAVLASLSACKIGAAALRARGIEVIEINGELAPETNAAALLAVVQRI